MPFNLLDCLLEPSPAVKGSMKSLETRISLAMQIALLFLWIIHDLMRLAGVFENEMPMGISAIILITYTIGRFRSVRLSTFLMLLSMNAISFFDLASGDVVSANQIFGEICWLAWFILLGTYLLDIRGMIALVAVDLAGLILATVMIPSITPDMMMGPFAFISGLSLIAVLASWLRKTNMDLIMQQSRTLTEQKTELELYSSIIRHDLRNDLGVILGAADTCMMVEEKDIIEDSMEVLVAASERMLNLLNAFRQTPSEEYHDIITMIESVAKQAEKAHPNLTINVDADEKARDMSVGPVRLLPIVFENLFRNASVYAGETPMITVTVTGYDAGLQIDVSDDGPGISPTVRDRLFQRGASSSGKGKGLGLYLSKRVVESQGGSLDLLETTAGCVFRIRVRSRNH